MQEIPDGPILTESEVGLGRALDELLNYAFRSAATFRPANAGFGNRRTV